MEVDFVNGEAVLKYISARTGWTPYARWLMMAMKLIAKKLPDFLALPNTNMLTVRCCRPGAFNCTNITLSKSPLLLKSNPISQFTQVQITEENLFIVNQRYTLAIFPMRQPRRAQLRLLHCVPLRICIATRISIHGAGHLSAGCSTYCSCWLL